MTIFQIISVLFALFMMYVVSIHGKKRTLSVMEVSFWWSTWVLFIVVSLFPNLLMGMVHVLKFSRVFDLLVVMALMVLTVMIFGSYFSQKEAATKLETFIRTQALAKPVSTRKHGKK